MKHIFILILLCFLIGKQANAQGEVKLSDIKTPVSPGFVIADVTPSSIEKPSTPKGVVASLLSIKNGGSLEVSPYWIIKSKSRESLLYDTFIKRKFFFAKTLSFSISTFKSDTGSYLSVGARFRPISIFSNGQIAQITAKQGEIVAELSQLPANINLQKLERLTQELDDLDKQPLLSAEIAGALLGYSTNKSYEGLKTSRMGFWANICFIPPKTNLEVILLARYLKNRETANFTKEANLFDFGTSIGFEKDKFSFHTEFVYRKDNFLQKDYHRIAAVLNYKLNDQIYFVGSIGKNFTNVNNIIALLGINFGLSKDQLKLQ